MADIFSWYMSAALHRDSVEALRREILESYQNQSPLPVGLILQLLPLQTPNEEEISMRGSFEWQGETFTNGASAETWVEFSDPVLGNFSSTIPPTWRGTIDVRDGEITLNFIDALKVSIPEIANQGINRSIQQRFDQAVLTAAFSRSRFVDVSDENKISLIVATLDPTVDLKSGQALGVENEAHIADSARDLEFYRAISTGSSCGGGDPDEPNWYVYRRVNDGLCIIHYGRINVGGVVAYVYEYGPDTKAACDRFWRDNCDTD